MSEAVEATRADSSLIMVPASVAREAILEAIDAGIKLIVYPGEGLPVRDMLVIKSRLNASDAALLGTPRE